MVTLNFSISPFPPQTSWKGRKFLTNHSKWNVIARMKDTILKSPFCIAAI